MSTEAIFWILAATILAGVHTSIGKIISSKKINSSINSALTFLVSAFIFSICAFVWQEPLPKDVWLIFGLAFASGAVYGVSFIARIQALNYIDSVLFFPINKILGPIITVFMGVFLFSESLTHTQIFGVIVSIFVPLLLISKHEKIRQTNLNIGLLLVVLATVTGTFQAYFLKTAFNIHHYIFLIIALTQFFAFVSSCIIFLYNQKKTEVKFEFAVHDFKYGVFSGLVGSLSFASFSKALSIAPISLVYTIHAHYILIPILFSVIYYKEHMDIRKLLAVVLSMLAIGFLV